MCEKLLLLTEKYANEEKITLPRVLDGSNGASSEYTKFDDCGSYSGVETLCTLLYCNKC